MNEPESVRPVITEHATSSLRNPHVWMATVCGLAFFAYLTTLGFQFVHDDRGQIVGNPAVHSWQAVPGYFTSHVWAAVAPAFLGNDYRPLFLLWLRINDALFGMRPAGWHFTTVTAHVIATYCVMLLARRIFREWPPAVITGVIFGVHPIHIEAVAWISGLPEPLVAIFLISAYLCWLRSREAASGGRKWLGASLALYALALLTKETAVVLLLILCASLWLHFPRAGESLQKGWVRRSLQGFRTLVPYFLLTGIYATVRTIALKGFSHPPAHISWLTMVLTWPALLTFYLKLLVWPLGLSPFYGLQFVSHPTLRNTALPALALLLVGTALWKWASLDRPVSLAIPWLIFPVLPVLDVQVFGNGNFAHNRYLYLPSVGFSILVAAALRHLKFGRPVFAELPSSQIWVSLGLALFFTGAIQMEDRCYANDGLFYSYAYARLGNRDPIIGMDYANTLAEQGDFAGAAAIYQRLIQAHPDMSDAYFNMGYMYYQEGQMAPAVQYLKRAAAGNPASAGAAFYLGLAEFKLHDWEQAEADLRRAIALAPTAPNYHFALGVLLKIRGNLPAAEAEFRKELALNPGQPAAAQQAAEIAQRLAGR